MAKNKTEIHVTTVFDGELDATDVFVSLISQKYGKTNTEEYLPLVCATPKSSHSKCVHHRGSPLNRRNGSDLPSSLTRIRSIALVFST